MTGVLSCIILSTKPINKYYRNGRSYVVTINNTEQQITLHVTSNLKCFRWRVFILAKYIF